MSLPVRKSLTNLDLETIDVQQFHVWSDEWADQGDWLEAVQKLKAEGKIRSFGVSINDYQPENAIKLIKTGVVDSVQVIYSVFEQGPEERFVIRHKTVSTVIPGMRSIRNVERNCPIGDGHGLPKEQVELLKGHRWARNFYG